jgi:biopolymer transport protein ExbD
MARRSLHRYEREGDDEARIEMTPMIDVTFLLLVFFLCTLRFKTLEGKLDAYLPKDVGLGVQPADLLEPIAVTLRVVAEGERRAEADPSRAWSGRGRYVFAGRELAYRVGPRSAATPEALAARVRELKTAAPERDVKLDVGPGALHGEAVAVLDALSAEGITDIVLRGAER